MIKNDITVILKNKTYPNVILTVNCSLFKVYNWIENKDSLNGIICDCILRDLQTSCSIKYILKLKFCYFTVWFGKCYHKKEFGLNENTKKIKKK